MTLTTRDYFLHLLCVTHCRSQGRGYRPKGTPTSHVPLTFFPIFTSTVTQGLSARDVWERSFRGTEGLSNHFSYSLSGYGDVGPFSISPLFQDLFLYVL